MKRDDCAFHNKSNQKTIDIPFFNFSYWKQISLSWNLLIKLKHFEHTPTPPTHTHSHTKTHLQEFPFGAYNKISEIRRDGLNNFFESFDGIFLLFNIVFVFLFSSLLLLQFFSFDCLLNSVPSIYFDYYLLFLCFVHSIVVILY